MLFILYSCLTTLATTSTTLLNRSEESGLVVADFGKKTFSLSPLNIILAESVYRCPLSR